LAARRSIGTSLFIANAAIITLTTAIMVTYIALWGAARLREDMVARLDERAEAARNSIDDALRKMDSVSISVLYSKLVKDRFAAYSSALAASSSTGDDVIVDLLFAIIGPTMPVRQINIYDLYGKGFGTGMDNRSKAIDVATPWFAQAIEAGGSMVLSRPHKDPSLNRFGSRSDTEDELFVSLGRVLFDRYNTPIGVVEIEQSCDELFRDLSAGEEVGEPRTFVADEGGYLLYPYEGSGGAAEGVGSMAGRRLERGAKSEVSPWTTTVVADEAALLQPVRAFIGASVLLALALLSAAIVLSFAMARRITRPLSELHGEIAALELGSLAPSAERPRGPRGGSPYEIEDLHSAFGEMRSKLKRSVDDAISAQRAEAEAKMLALQSQMDPHFIYNTIATIGALAEEGEGQRAADLCAQLSDMLRYVASRHGTEVSASDELGFTVKYMGCIGARFGERLSYSLEADPSFASVSLPRLLIQPIVENSVKYATSGEPPWSIRVRASAEAGAWRVLVEDDGPGFSREALEAIAGRIGSGEEGARDGSEAKTGGIGLANIAARLKLRYGAGAVFEYGNRPGGGAFVSIGGADA
jgi:two-component system sensor histidine kinase YesM